MGTATRVSPAPPDPGPGPSRPHGPATSPQPPPAHRPAPTDFDLVGVELGRHGGSGGPGWRRITATAARRGGGERAGGARAPDIPAEISREGRGGRHSRPRAAGTLRKTLWSERGALAALLDGARGPEVT